MRAKGFCACAVLAFLAAAAGQTQERKISLVPVSYEGLKQEVLKNRGKVLVVDFWGALCMPCKKAFPHFVAMHRKYADQGLVVITVATDNAPDIEKKVKIASAFLAEANSPFLNLHLTDPIETWQKKIALETLPCYYVFDRHGKWVRFGGNPESGVNYEELEDAVKQMLREK